MIAGPRMNIELTR